MELQGFPTKIPCVFETRRHPFEAFQFAVAVHYEKHFVCLCWIIFVGCLDFQRHAFVVGRFVVSKKNIHLAIPFHGRFGHPFIS